MRILHVTDTFLPVVGGIEVLVDDLARHQRALGHDVRVLTATPAGRTRPGEGSVVRLRHPLLAPVADAVDGHRPDVVHGHSSIGSPLTWRAARHAAQARVPVVVTMHSFAPGRGVVATGLRHAARLLPPAVHWTAVSGVAARALEPVVGAVVDVLPNGIDVAACPIAAPGTADVPTLAAVMRLARRKRPLALVEILAEVRDRLGGRPWRAVLAGDGPLAAATARAVRRAGLDDVVHLAGARSRPDVLRLLAAADVFVAPAHLESFGIAALEARCSGLPVVAMRGSGVGEFVRDGVHGFLVDDDAGMARRLADLLDDRALLRATATASRLDPPDLDWPTVVRRSIDAYARAAATDVTAGATWPGTSSGQVQVPRASLGSMTTFDPGAP